MMEVNYIDTDDDCNSDIMLMQRKCIQQQPARITQRSASNWPTMQHEFPMFKKMIRCSNSMLTLLRSVFFLNSSTERLR